uniref:Uncharacterized protein n=1 Tax=Sphaerodactylus townsendi TaxID=933632 RepID=A0ACB8F2C0_9SAUR
MFFLRMLQLTTLQPGSGPHNIFQSLPQQHPRGGYKNTIVSTLAHTSYTCPLTLAMTSRQLSQSLPGCFPSTPAIPLNTYKRYNILGSPCTRGIRVSYCLRDQQKFSGNKLRRTKAPFIRRDHKLAILLIPKNGECS